MDKSYCTTLSNCVFQLLPGTDEEKQASNDADKRSDEERSVNENIESERGVICKVVTICPFHTAQPSKICNTLYRCSEKKSLFLSLGSDALMESDNCPIK